MARSAPRRLLCSLAFAALTSGCALGPTWIGLPPPASPKEPLPKEPEVQRVFVTIDADRLPAKLIRLERWKSEEVVCDAPCNRVIEVPRKAWFYITAEKSQPTMFHKLDSPEDPVAWIHVNTSNTVTYHALKGLGIVHVVAGSLMVLGSLISIPWAKKSQQGITDALATGTTGLMMVPTGTMFWMFSDMFLSRSEWTFKDPRKRPDLRVHF